jgi:hypothetical protein
MRYLAMAMLLALLAVPFVGGCKKEQPPEKTPPTEPAPAPAPTPAP